VKAYIALVACIAVDLVRLQWRQGARRVLLLHCAVSRGSCICCSVLQLILGFHSSCLNNALASFDSVCFSVNLPLGIYWPHFSRRWKWSFASRRRSSRFKKTFVVAPSSSAGEMEDTTPGISWKIRRALQRSGDSQTWALDMERKLLILKYCVMELPVRPRNWTDSSDSLKQCLDDI